MKWTAPKGMLVNCICRSVANTRQRLYRV